MAGHGHSGGHDFEHRVRNILAKIAFLFELAVAVVALVIIVIEMLNLISHNLGLFHFNAPYESYGHALEGCLEVVIGVEFVKLLCHHDMRSVTEVLILMLARHLVAGESTMNDTIICCIAIAAIYAIRKFLLVKGVDIGESDIHGVAHIDSEEDAEESSEDRHAVL